MKLGLGLYYGMLDDSHFRFARQCGVTHIVVHLHDYGRAGSAAEWWNPAGLARLRRKLKEHDLELHAIENFDPADWHDVLLAGPRREEQITRLQNLVRIAGDAGVAVIGYNFSLAGNCSRETGRFARGGASSIAMRQTDQRPIPQGMVWNTVYDPSASAGAMPFVPRAEQQARHDFLLEHLLPVAERAGVILAMHPEDPPVEILRSQPRFIRGLGDYEELLLRHSSRSWGLELCLGTVAEMPGADVYAAVDRFSRQDRIAYIHFRNVQGKAPSYVESFVDEGDIDMLRVVRLLTANGYTGVLVPDHTPRLECAASWHAGMAHALGFISAAIAAAR